MFHNIISFTKTSMFSVAWIFMHLKQQVFLQCQKRSGQHSVNRLFNKQKLIWCVFILQWFPTKPAITCFFPLASHYKHKGQPTQLKNRKSCYGHDPDAASPMTPNAVAWKVVLHLLLNQCLNISRIKLVEMSVLFTVQYTVQHNVIIQLLPKYATLFL